MCSVLLAANTSIAPTNRHSLPDDDAVRQDLDAYMKDPNQFADLHVYRVTSTQNPTLTRAQNYNMNRTRSAHLRKDLADDFAGADIKEHHDVTPVASRPLKRAVHAMKNMHHKKLRKAVLGYSPVPPSHLDDFENRRTEKEQQRLKQEQESAQQCINLLDTVIELMVRAH